MAFSPIADRLVLLCDDGTVNSGRSTAPRTARCSSRAPERGADWRSRPTGSGSPPGASTVCCGCGRFRPGGPRPSRLVCPFRWSASTPLESGFRERRHGPLPRREGPDACHGDRRFRGPGDLHPRRVVRGIAGSRADGATVRRLGAASAERRGGASGTGPAPRCFDKRLTPTLSCTVRNAALPDVRELGPERNNASPTHGADTNAADEKGTTALILASADGDRESVVLLGHGADLTAMDDDDRSGGRQRVVQRRGRRPPPSARKSPRSEPKP